MKRYLYLLLAIAILGLIYNRVSQELSGNDIRLLKRGLDLQLHSSEETMTVSQLIELLKDMPQNAVVVYSVDSEPEMVDAVFSPGKGPWKDINGLFDDKVVLW